MEKYKICEKLGEGSFGTVHRCVKNGVSYAVKIIRQVNLFKKQQVDQETSIMIKCLHNNLVRIYEDIYDEDNETSYIIMDYCQQGDLLKYYKSKNRSFDNKQVVGIMKQIVSAFNFLSGKKIIHRDLKPENILVAKNGLIKIADFGCARKTQDFSKIIAMSLDKGTPCFASPELLLSQPYSGKCDVWSAGCIIYFLVTKKHPFFQKQVASILKLIKQKIEFKEIQIQTNLQVSDEVRYIIKRSLKYRQVQRSSWREFYLSRVFAQKLTSIRQYLDYLKNISNIANWLSKTFWKQRKKFKFTQNKDEIFIYFIIKFQFSSLKLGQKIIEKDNDYKYLFEELAWKKLDLDQFYINQYKTIHLQQAEEYFNLIKKSIKSEVTLKVISQKQSNLFLPFADLENSIRAAYRILVEIQEQITSESDKVMAQMARWVNFQRFFDVENKPNLQKLLAQKIFNVKEIVKEEILSSISGEI